MVRPYLREKIDRTIIGTHVEMIDTVCSDILGRVGFDFVLIDATASENSYTSLRNHMVSLNAGGTPTVVRLENCLTSHVGRVLELGPDGVIFSGVNNADEAENMMSLCLYPPEGRRRYAPLRAVGYSLDDAMRFVRADSTAMCRFVQLDTAASLRALPEIIKNPLIDGFFFAPGELCRSDGMPDGIFGANTESLLKEATGILKDEKKPFGVSAPMSGTKVLEFWRGIGATIFASGTDFGYILGGASDNLKKIQKMLM